MTTTPPPPVVKDSKSRFFGPQKSKPWEEEEQPVIEILSAPDERNAAPPQASPSDAAEEEAEALVEPTTKENEANVKLATEDIPKDDASSNIFAKFAFGAAASGSKSQLTTNSHPSLRNGRQPPLLLPRNRILKRERDRLKKSVKIGFAWWIVPRKNKNASFKNGILWPTPPPHSRLDAFKYLWQLGFTHDVKNLLFANVWTHCDKNMHYWMLRH